jgi:hypothetical protein
MKKERAKHLSKRLAIALAVLALGFFFFHEVFADSLKRLSDNLGAAKETFQRSSDVSEIEMYSEVLRMKLAQVQAQEANADQDFTAMTREQQQEAKLVNAKMQANFESLSKFIDALPRIPKGVIYARKTLRELVEQVDASVPQWSTKAQKDRSDSVPLVLAIGVQIRSYAAEIGVILLGDWVLKTAEQEKSGLETLQTLCRWASWVCGCFAAILGLYRAKFLAGTEIS